MADGDVFSRRVRMWWKSTARKAYDNDPTFESSAVRSVRKMFGLGNCRGFLPIVEAMTEAAALRQRGIDSQVFLAMRLEQIQREYPDGDTNSAVRAARQLGQNLDWCQENEIIGQRLAFIGRRLLVELISDYVGDTLLRDAILIEQGRYRRNQKQIECCLMAIRSQLLESQALLAVAEHNTLSSGEGVLNEASIRLLVTSPDYRSLVFESFGS